MKSSTIQGIASMRDGDMRSATYVDRRAFLLGASAATLMSARASAAGPMRVAVLHPVNTRVSRAAQAARAGVHLGWQLAGANEGLIELIDVDLDDDLSAIPAQIETLVGEGVAALIGGLTSAHTMAIAVGAKPYSLPFMVDSAGSDAFLGPNFPHVFRLAPGFDSVLRDGLTALAARQSGALAAVRVSVISDNSAFAETAAPRILDRLDEKGFAVNAPLNWHGKTGMRSIIASLKNTPADIIVPVMARHRLDALLAAIHEADLSVRTIFTVLALNNLDERFDDRPGFERLVDANHGVLADNSEGRRLRDAIAGAGLLLEPAVFLAVNAMHCLAVAVRDAPSPAMLGETLAASSTDPWGMPYGSTLFVDGRNLGAHGVLLDVTDGGIVIAAQSAPDTRDL